MYRSVTSFALSMRCSLSRPTVTVWYDEAVKEWRCSECAHSSANKEGTRSHAKKKHPQFSLKTERAAPDGGKSVKNLTAFYSCIITTV